LRRPPCHNRHHARATKVLDGLPDAELRAIAQGKVDINNLTRDWNA